MRRAGGYRTFHAAYQRELIRDARPLDDVWVGATARGGQYTCTVCEIQHGWEHLRARCDFGAGRRIWVRLESSDVRSAQLCSLLGTETPDPGEWRHLGADLLGAQLEVDVEVGGEVDVLVCSDRTYIIVDTAGGAPRARCNEWSEVDSWLEKTGVTRRRARVTTIRGIRPATANG